MAADRNDLIVSRDRISRYRAGLDTLDPPPQTSDEIAAVAAQKADADSAIVLIGGMIIRDESWAG